MRRFIFSALAMIMLSACIGSNRNVPILPSSTMASLPARTEVTTPTIKVSETPQPSPSSTPVPLSLILADFPLVLGTTWVYSAEISYQDPNDYMNLLTWTGTVTDAVIDKKTESDGKVVFTVQEDLEPKPPEDVWRKSGTFEYTITGDGVFEGRMKVYQYPLEDNQTWQAFSDFGYEMMVHRIGQTVTPYGKVDNCFNLIIATNPDISIETFCAGIGFVEHSYRHHGTPQIEKFTLSAFTLGQP